MNIQEINAITKEISSITKDKIGDIYVSGGCVLDMMLGYDSYDIDVFIHKDMGKSMEVVPITTTDGTAIDVVYVNTHPVDKARYFDFPIKSSYVNNGELFIADNFNKLVNEELLIYPNRDISVFRYIKAIDKYGFTPDKKLVYILNNYLLWKYRTRRPIRVADKYKSYFNSFVAWASREVHRVDVDLAKITEEVICYNKKVNATNTGEYKTFHDYYKYITL